ncbi:hypothetical protein TL16_g05533 [Triparma laevis f. inornata]|uniref:FAD/NAD(P)-binding domain-containing protein n=1 Tax=Triparma laevis f. inornata TaxID=1714386 RepID=A0A9W7AJ88_9STRA|nr:hypothetical protein TL16_g05533 [Triparma laevis f. inornata]
MSIIPVVELGQVVFALAGETQKRLEAAKLLPETIAKVKRTVGQVQGSTEQVQEDKATEHVLQSIRLKLDQINNCMTRLLNSQSASQNASTITRCCGLLAQGQDVLDIERELVGLEEGLDGDLERLVKATQLAEYSNRSSGVLKESFARNFWDKHFHDQRSCGINELVEALKFESREWMKDAVKYPKFINWNQVEPSIRVAFGCEGEEDSNKITVLQFGELLGNAPLYGTLTRLEMRQTAATHLVKLLVYRVPSRKPDPKLDGLALLVRTTDSLSELREAAVLFAKEAEVEDGEGSMPEFLVSGEFEFFLDEASTRVRRKQENGMSGTKYLNRAVIVPRIDLPKPKKKKTVTVNVIPGKKYAPIVPDDSDTDIEEDVSKPDLAARIMHKVEKEKALRLTVGACLQDKALTLALRRYAVELGVGEASVDFLTKLNDLKDAAKNISISGAKLRVVRAGSKALSVRFFNSSGASRFPTHVQPFVAEAGAKLQEGNPGTDEMLAILATVAEPVEECLKPCLNRVVVDQQHTGRVKHEGIIKAKKANTNKTRVVVCGGGTGGLTIAGELCSTDKFEVVLVDPKEYFEDVTAQCRSIVDPGETVVVCGGGTGGLTIAGELCSTDKFEVVLVDPKEYFEDVTAQCRSIVDPGETYDGKEDKSSQFAKTVFKFSDSVASTANLVCGKVTGVRTTHIEVGAARTVIPYDYLVLGTGSHYKSDIKTDNRSVEFRHQQMVAEYDALKAANHVLIVGGGLVGVEIAGDVAEAFKDQGKKVTLVHAHDKLLKNVQGAHELAMPVLEGLGVNVILEARIFPNVGKVTDTGTQAGSSIGCSTFTTTKGDHIVADKVIWCTGYVPNTTFMNKQESDKVFVNSLDRHGFVRVNSTFQVHGCENVFACGDIVSSSSAGCVFSTVSPDGDTTRAERTSSAAFFHAVAIGENLKRLADGAADSELVRFDYRRIGARAEVGISIGASTGLTSMTKMSYVNYTGMFGIEGQANLEELEQNGISLDSTCPKFKEAITDYLVGNWTNTEMLLGTVGMYRTFPTFIDPKAAENFDIEVWKSATEDFPAIKSLEEEQLLLLEEQKKTDASFTATDLDDMREKLKAELASEEKTMRAEAEKKRAEEIEKLKAEITKSTEESGKRQRDEVAELKAQLEEAKATVLSPINARSPRKRRAKGGQGGKEGSFSFSEVDNEASFQAVKDVQSEMADLKAQLVEAIAGINDRAPESESMQRMKDDHEQEILSLKAEIEAQRAIHEANLAASRLARRYRGLPQ